MQFFGILFKAPHSDTVDMGNFGLRNVPSTVTEITSLTCLKLFNNYITSLPSDIGNFHVLSELWLSYNQLKKLIKVC
jgi:Leucine-rich repeat (LRR) protein